jgi:hypothetical protein
LGKRIIIHRISESQWSPGFSSPHDTISSQPVPANPTHRSLSRSKRQSIIKSLPLPANRIHPSAPGRPMTDGPWASLPHMASGGGVPGGPTTPSRRAAPIPLTGCLAAPRLLFWACLAGLRLLQKRLRLLLLRWSGFSN